MARGTIANGLNKQRTEVFNRMRAVDDALDQSEESSADSVKVDDLSDEILSSDDELIEMFDYENEITRNMWTPNEPKLFVIFNGRRFVDYDDEGDLMYA